MKKIFVLLVLIVGLAGCSASDFKFDSQKEAEQALMKGVVDGEVDLDLLNDHFVAEGKELTEEDFEAIEKYSKLHLEDGAIEITRDDNVTHIQEKPAEAFGTDLNIFWTYEDGTYKIEDVEAYE